MIEFQNIPFYFIIKLVFEILLIIFIFWAFSRYAIKWIKDDKLHDQVLFYTPVVKNIFWILLVSYIFFLLINVNIIFGLVLLALFCAFLWNYIKNLFHGIVYKIQKGDVTGKGIIMKDHSGVIASLRNTKIDIELQNGEVIQYPYHILSTEAISKPSSGNLSKVSILLNIEDNKKDNYLESIKKRVFTYPYVISPEKAIVEFILDEKEEQKLRVIVFTSNQKYVPRITKYIKSFE